MPSHRNKSSLTEFYKASAKNLVKLTYLPFTATYYCLGGNADRHMPGHSILPALGTLVISPALFLLSIGTTALSASLALLLAITALFTYPIALRKDSVAEDNWDAVSTPGSVYIFG